MRLWEIDGLDVFDSGTRTSLRQTINGLISTTSSPPCRLIHSIDKSYQEGAVVVTFHPDREEETRARMMGLIPYLKYVIKQEHPGKSPSEMEKIFSHSIYRYFTQEALHRAEGAYWDPDTNSVKSPQDDEIDAMEDIDLEYDFARFTDVDADD